MDAWESFLREHPGNHMRIRNEGTSRWLELGAGNKPTFFNWRDVSNAANSLREFMDRHITAHQLEDIYVMFRKANGASWKTVASAKDILINVGHRLHELKDERSNKDAAPPSVPQAAHPAHPIAQPPKHHSPNEFERNTMYQMGGLGAAGMAAGMGYRELVTMEKKAEMSDHYKGEMERYKKENDLLVIDNRDLQSKVVNAEKEKEIAVKETKLAAKSWSDPENVNALFQNMGPVIQAVLAKGQVNTSPQLGMGSAEGLSEIKQNFIGYLTDLEFSDQHVELLESALVLLVQKEGFAEEFRTWLQQKLANGPDAT